MQLSTLLNLRVALVGIALLLAAIGISNGFVAVFFQARHEVIYRFDVTARFCAGA